MTNPTLKTILRESHKEHEIQIRNTKLCLCEDIIKAKRTLWAFGEKQHNEFLLEDTATKLFDKLYDMDIETLTVINDNYGKKINELIIVRMEAVK